METNKHPLEENLPSELMVNGQKAYAVGLHWQVLLGHGTIESQIAECAKAKKAQSYLRYSPPLKVVNEDVFGFYKGKVAKIIDGLTKVSPIALAAMFAKKADADSIFIYQLEEDKYGLMACRNNHPAMDLIHLTHERLLQIAQEFKVEQGARGATLYFDQTIPTDSPLLQTLQSSYPVLKPAPASFLEADTTAELKPVPAQTPWMVIVVTVLITMIAYLAYDWYSSKQMSMNALKSVVPVEKIYEGSRNLALAESGRISAAEFVKALRASQVWRSNLSATGWMLGGVQCSFSEAVACNRSWFRKDGLTESLSKALNKPVKVDSLDVVSDVFQLTIPLYELNQSTFGNENEQRLIWSTWMQLLANKAESVGVEKLNNLKLELGSSQLMGQWPVGQPNMKASEVVLRGTWSIEGDLVWFAELENLTPEFLMSSFFIGRDKVSGQMVFKAAGVYLSKGG